MAEVQIKKVGWWHERLADWLIANPQSKLGDAALFFDCSRAWISIVKNSDAFKAYFAERSQLASDATLVDIKARMTAVAELGLEILQEKLETSGSVLPMEEVRETTALALKGLGYTASSRSAPPSVSTSVAVVVDAELLARAREHRSRLYGGVAEGDLLPLPPCRLETSAGGE